MKAKLEAAKIGKQLTYVTVSMNYFSVLLNWLIYAKSNAMPLLENLLVVCTDKSSRDILSQKGILSQLVTINDIIYSIKDMDGSGIFSARVITRLTILRLLNYWGYDVLIMDIDAILINNIQPIFDHLHDSDIISSTANAPNCLPSAARKAWSFCLCIGLLLIRGNANTERMWQKLGSTPVELASSDQTRFSSILIKSNITWTPFDYDKNYYLKGKSQKKGITLIALPQEVVCRNQCNTTRLSSYYVYHPMTTHHVDVKQDIMTAQKVWRVSNHWNLTLKTVQSTTDWLNEVTV
ncbi:uncharacterized protein [Dysidea avara]|uniref:uncharacterized protein n=1 Tax=Dysidea avara TaxID=196820 RepID=UPI00332759D2